VVREATIKGDRWYRVVVGQFDSKTEAAKYRTRAQEKFRVDWVGVVRR
jgi:cell division protein FtsN